MKDHITQFTIREEALLARARAVGFTLPERLSQWTLWIQDSELYLNELRQAVVNAEKSASNSAKEIKNIYCPYCRGTEITILGEWDVQSLERQDRYNTATLTECQCSGCKGRSFWIDKNST